MRFATILLGSLTMVGAAHAAQAAAQPFRLCVLDQARILQNTRLAKDIGARFQRVREQLQSKLEEERRTLDADARALDGLRASLPAQVAKSRDAAIAERRTQLKAREEQANTNLATLDGQLTENISRISEPFVRAIEAERGCSMLVGKETLLHLRDTSLDITPAVIQRMNAGAAAKDDRTPATDMPGR